ncbi:MAG: DUF1778 domain-containing protein [Thermomicrobiales bacterium]
MGIAQVGGLTDMATAVATKQDQQTITVKITAEQKELFQRAAAVQRLTLNEFIVATLNAEADDILFAYPGVVTQVSSEEYERIIDRLDEPGEPSERLRAAFQRYRDVFGE